MNLQDPATLSAPVSPSATQVPYAIGDLQGCSDSLTLLLDKLALKPEQPLWFVGDLVNRGPHSLATLRKIIQLGPRATAILGNHDLHLLAVFAGVRQQKAGDTLEQILNADDAEQLIDWLRHRPLAHFDGARLLVHAGVLPQWDVTATLAMAGEIEAQLRAPGWRKFIGDLFAQQTQPWHPGLKGIERMRAAANVLTRIRLCNAAGELEAKYSGPPAGAPVGFMPWFDVPGRKTAEVTVVFGHWAALGLVLRENLCALDTGCVWGNRLTAVPLHLDPIKRVPIQVECPKMTTKMGARGNALLNAS